MSADEFLTAREEPRQAKRISEVEANKAHNRLPADLIAFGRSTASGITQTVITGCACRSCLTIFSQPY